MGFLRADLYQLHSNGGTGFQPVHAQAEACGYQKLPYDCDKINLSFEIYSRRILYFFT